eukprot:GHVS01063543.1.p1 GENE.GHVS01063543.1~~GHVS01063543.1.p1  ORF type:complete len:124 (+),score=17.99 GHVS01063543.1:216-587(+)
MVTTPVLPTTVQLAVEQGVVEAGRWCPYNKVSINTQLLYMSVPTIPTTLLATTTANTTIHPDTADETALTTVTITSTIAATSTTTTTSIATTVLETLPLGLGAPIWNECLPASIVIVSFLWCV